MAELTVGDFKDLLFELYLVRRENLLLQARQEGQEALNSASPPEAPVSAAEGS